MTRLRLLKMAGVCALVGVSGVLVWFTAIGGTAYVYAGYLESQWVPENPRTRAQLESHLHLYSTCQIEPRESLWGNSCELALDERMIQYRILWSAPLDVVYDKENNIRHIFTSYE